MVVQVEQIREEGLNLVEPIKREVFVEALSGPRGKDTGFEIVNSSPLSVELHKVSGGVLLKGKFDARVQCPCKRCLRDVESDLPVRFTLNLVSRAEMPANDGAEAEDDEVAEAVGSFELGDADDEWFDGRTIDLDPIVQEQVLLALPMNVLCKEDCLGLCPSCGQDLNEAKCGCDTKVVDPRFATLKNIKLN
jgi:uncharacterized protein